jgi:hypothetical protein
MSGSDKKNQIGEAASFSVTLFDTLSSAQLESLARVNTLFEEVVISPGVDLSKEAKVAVEALLYESERFALVSRSDLRRSEKPRIIRFRSDGSTSVLLFADPKTGDEVYKDPRSPNFAERYAVFHVIPGTTSEDIAARPEDFVLIKRSDMEKPLRDVEPMAYEFKDDGVIDYMNDQTSNIGSISIEALRMAGRSSRFIFMKRKAVPKREPSGNKPVTGVQESSQDTRQKLGDLLIPADRVGDFRRPGERILRVLDPSVLDSQIDKDTDPKALRQLFRGKLAALELENDGRGNLCVQVGAHVIPVKELDPQIQQRHGLFVMTNNDLPCLSQWQISPPEAATRMPGSSLPPISPGRTEYYRKARPKRRLSPDQKMQKRLGVLFRALNLRVHCPYQRRDDLCIEAKNANDGWKLIHGVTNIIRGRGFAIVRRDQTFSEVTGSTTVIADNIRIGLERASWSRSLESFARPLKATGVTAEIQLAHCDEHEIYQVIAKLIHPNKP